MILYKNGLALIGGKLTKNDIVANHGKIIEIAPEIVADEQTEVVDCTGKYILPALVDIHTHGANGYDFNTADLDGMKKIMEFYVSHGVGTVFPTVMTDSDEVICRQVELICKLAQDYPEVKGINLEGPFLSSSPKVRRNASAVLAKTVGGQVYAISKGCKRVHQTCNRCAGTAGCRCVYFRSGR